MSSSEKSMYSLGPGKFCANCLGKLAGLKFHETRGLYCTCAECRIQKFSRCGKCHIVPYCSRECQLEHWRHHKKVCRKFSSEVMAVPRLEEDFFTVNMLNFTVRMFSHSFKTNGFMLVSQSKPQLLPVPFKWDTSHPRGWIEEYLMFLARLTVSLLGKDRKNTELLSLAQNFATLRGFYLFLVATEKERKMTELKFAVMVLSCVSLTLETQIQRHEIKTRRSAKIKKKLWETFMLSLANFYCKLRMVKYKFINVKSLEKKRHGKYETLKLFVVQGLRQLEQDGISRDADGKLSSCNSSVTLPRDTVCIGCAANLGGKEAQLLIKQPSEDIWSGKVSIIRVSNTPCILMASGIVTCGADESCNSRAKDIYLATLVQEGSAFMKFLAVSRVCHGCSLFSLKTHRCSRCRQARFCSQNCLNSNWRDHKIHCQPFTRPGNWELYESKKLKGEAKTNHFSECSDLLKYFFDPFIGSAFKFGYKKCFLNSRH